MKRRDFLTAAPVAAIIPLVVSGRSAASLGVEAENPVLIELGKAQTAVEANYHEACAAWDAMWEKWSPQWPLAPDTCVCEGGLWSSDYECDLSGAELIRHGEVRPKRIFRIADMEARRAHMKDTLEKANRRKKPTSRKSMDYWHAEVGRAERGIAALPGYLAECDRIKAASDFKRIDEERKLARDRMFAFAREVLEEPSSTIDGVKVKAAALAAIGRLRAPDDFIGNTQDSITGKVHMAALLGQAIVDLSNRV